MNISNFSPNWISSLHYRTLLDNIYTGREAICTRGEPIDILLLSSHAIKPHSNVLFTYIDLHSSPPRLVKLCIAVGYG